LTNAAIAKRLGISAGRGVAVALAAILIAPY
jgi:hypothetical protein